MDASQQRTLKLIFLGEAGVGKSALLERFVHDRFASEQSNTTIGVAFMSKEIQLDDWVVTLQMWDTAGQERYRAIGPLYFRGAECCLLVYDVTSRSSFEAIEQWRDAFNASGQVEGKGFAFVVVGNKADKETERQVGWSEAQTWARNHGDLPLFETSALQGSNVKEAFEQAARLAVAKVR